MRSFLRENFGLEQDALNEMFEEIENFYFGDIDEMSEEVFPRFMKVIQLLTWTYYYL